MLRKYAQNGLDRLFKCRHNRGADFSRGLHWCSTQELTGLCSSSVTVVSYHLVISHTKLRLTVSRLAF